MDEASECLPKPKKVSNTQGLILILLEDDMVGASGCLPKPKKVSNTQGLVLILLEDDMVGASGCFVAQKKTFTKILFKCKEYFFKEKRQG